jgi:signal transduction histidine kinase
MDWTNLLCLGLGFGLGLLVNWQRRKPVRGSREVPVDRPTPEQSTPPERLIVPPPTEAVPPPDPPDVLDSAVANRVEQLELAYHMAVEMERFKGGFLGRAAHELRSPLNGMMGMHQLLLQGLCDSPEEEKEFIAQANISAHRMLKMLDTSINVSRMEHGTVQPNLQPVPLAELLQKVYEGTHLLAQDRNLRLTVEPVDPEIYVLTDPVRLSQVLIHLVDTAIQLLPEGTITISAQVSPATRTVTLWIKDNLPMSDRSEPVNQLQIDDNSTPFPSPGLTLLTDQIILQCMQAPLAIVPTSDQSINDPNAPTWLQCSIPLAEP